MGLGTENPPTELTIYTAAVFCRLVDDLSRRSNSTQGIGTHHIGVSFAGLSALDDMLGNGLINRFISALYTQTR